MSKSDIPEDVFEVLPDFPRTRHLPQDPCAQRDDLILSQKEIQAAEASCDVILVDEKLDGANSGVAYR